MPYGSDPVRACGEAEILNVAQNWDLRRTLQYGDSALARFVYLILNFRKNTAFKSYGVKTK